MAKTKKAELLALLAEIYEADGPKEPRSGEIKTVPASEYASYSPDAIDHKWDFPARHLMHRVAIAIVGVGA